VHIVMRFESSLLLLWVPGFDTQKILLGACVVEESQQVYEMALELSKQAFELCREQDAPGLRAFLEEYPDVDVLLHEDEELGDTGRPCSIAGLAASHKPPRCLRVLLDFGVGVNERMQSVCACYSTAKQTCKFKINMGKQDSLWLHGRVKPSACS
jgi:hypothetical protein